MSDKISPNEAGYPGDEALAVFLRNHNCPLPIHVVKFRFWGSIVSIALLVSPPEEIKALWGAKLPEFEGEDDAQKFFDVMLSLWNGLAEINMAGNHLRLSQRHGLDTSLGLKAMIVRRLEELDAGFFSGFIGPRTTHDRGNARTESCEMKLLGLIDALEDLQFDLSERGLSYAHARKAFLRLDNPAQRIIDNVVKAANAERKFQPGNVAMN